MKICALTSGPTIPSANYRVRQYIPFLEKHGIHTKEYVPLWDKFSPPSDNQRKILRSVGMDESRYWNKLRLLDRYKGVMASYLANVSWIQKVLIPYHLTVELKVRKPMIFDLDDAIWLDEGKGFTDKIVKEASIVFAGNQYLADWASQYSSNIAIIPTAVNTYVYYPQTHASNKRFVIGWIGTSGNFNNLYNIKKSLAVFFARRPDAVLKIIADRYPSELSDLSEHIHFVQWNKETHASDMSDFSVGIMPLEDTEWTKGKCSFKMLQYMALSLPVIASPFGMNKELFEMGDIGLGPLSDSDWYDALEYVYLNQSSFEIKGRRGLAIIRNTFSIDIVATEIALQMHKLR